MSFQGAAAASETPPPANPSATSEGLHTSYSLEGNNTQFETLFYVTFVTHLLRVCTVKIVHGIMLTRAQKGMMSL